MGRLPDVMRDLGLWRRSPHPPSACTQRITWCFKEDLMQVFVEQG